MGQDFPRYTIRDMMEAQHALVSKGLGTLPCHLLPARFADGILLLMIFTATGSRRLAQMTPLTPLQVKVALFAGSVGFVAEALKFPTRSKSVGTIALFRNVLVVCRKPEYEKKKNVLSRRIGPPSVPPNWLR